MSTATAASSAVINLIDRAEDENDFSLATAATLELAASDPTHALDLVRSVRAAIIVRRSELAHLKAVGRVALARFLLKAAEASVYHVLPHHEGGYHVERNGVSLARCSSRQEAQKYRDALASGGRAIA